MSNNQQLAQESPVPKLSVVGISLNPAFRGYILWCLKLIKDVPSIFSKVAYYDEKTLAKAKDLAQFDIVITDTEKGLDKAKLKSNAVIAFIRNDDMNLSEMELLAKSGFLSIVNLANFTQGKSKLPNSLPQQPTTKLMFYYMYSLMICTKILLAIQNPRSKTEQIEIRNNPTDNLVYISQFINKLRDMGAWGSEQGQNLLDGGAHFYSIYKSKDRKYFTVSCIEPIFYKEFLSRLPLEETHKQFMLENQMNMPEWPDFKRKIQDAFSKQPAQYWKDLYKGTDACVTMVLDEVKVLNKKLFKDTIIQKPEKNDQIWNALQKELGLKDNVTIVPLAKL